MLNHKDTHIDSAKPQSFSCDCKHKVKKMFTDEPPIGGEIGNAPPASFSADSPNSSAESEILAVNTASFNLDFPTAMRITPGGKETVNGVAYFKYNISGNPYNGVGLVQIITEIGGNTGFTNITYTIPEAKHAKLYIWLINNSNPAPNSEPDIIIRGEGGGSVLSQLSPSHRNIPKPARPVRLYCSPQENPDLSVRKWEIVDSRGMHIFGDEGKDKFLFYVKFNH